MRALSVFTIMTALSLASEVLGQKQILNSTESSTTPNTGISNVTCITARKDAGTCVNRVRCDYGTSSIDFTLYVPYGYANVCSDDMVCCPLDYIIPEPDRIFREPMNFDFDDDD